MAYDNTSGSRTERTTRRRRGRGGHPRRTGDRPRNKTSPRRALRQETVSTIGVLADASDFAAMRRYRTFAFDDHTDYLRQLQVLLRSLASRHLHTTVVLFDPDDFSAFCSEEGIDPDSPLSRSRYTADAAGRFGTLPYSGEALDSLVPQLIERSVREATWQYATKLLADIGECADCGQDIGRAAFEKASRMLGRLLEGAGPGSHHLVCSVPAPSEQLFASLHAASTEDSPPHAMELDTSDGAEFVSVLATGIALGTAGGLVLRTRSPEAPDHLHGWRLHQGRLLPLTEAEVFSAYCTDTETGDPLPPEPGVEYRAGFGITIDDPETHH
ncbi:hypothetical protein [Streptomyces albipurpureus]|uniref:Uncharacterized protein n=1 Tax=Streptomyces albipurpureus TaxID=2897419 RepID=A0ABT0V1H6_9ACTN|nr:hypothetical protein [Streptomyces sp. CWNU-1]MCM2393428.1 hypothetical protein [Streptomyces sp. CWNU-1]